MIVLSAFLLREQTIGENYDNNDNIDEVEIQETEKPKRNSIIQFNQTQQKDNYNNDHFNNLNIQVNQIKSTLAKSDKKENNQKNAASFNNSIKNSIYANSNSFWSYLKKVEVYKPILFIFFYMIQPSYSGPLFYFYTNILKFSPYTMGRLKLVYGAASVLGIFIFFRYLRKVEYTDIIWTSTILAVIFNFLKILVVTRLNIKIGISDFWFCLITDSLTTALTEITTLPLLVMACNICPKNIEGTLYAFILSIMNLGSLIANNLGGVLCYYLGKLFQLQNRNYNRELQQFNLVNLYSKLSIVNSNSISLFS